jgi:Na+/H+ antiporter NhaD/arsenite permease-like protein
MENQENFRILGGWTLLLAFLPLICLVAAQRIQFPQEHLREAFLVVCLGIITFITRKLTPKQVDHANQFTWHLFSEQVVIWGALFITWIPVLSIFTQLAPQLSVDNSWRIFWLTGAFSAVFNQVPVFTAFYALARGVGEDVQMVQLISGNAISGLLLTSVICSSSLFSGATYVGNVSNLLVQRQVQLEGLRIPSGIKMIIASLILVAPVAFITAFVFFVR